MLVNALRRFRESMRRVTDGAEAFLILTLFILCLDKVSTDHAKLVPLGKVCTAKETLEKNTAKGTKCKLEALISLTDDHSLLSKMAALESCPKHNMIAYLEKTEGNVEFHEYRPHCWETVLDVAKSTNSINNVKHITAKIAGKVVSISEASIRTDLIFDDADGIDTLPNQAIFDAIQRMGYEGDLTTIHRTLHQHPIVPDSIPEPTGENLGDHSSNDTSLSGNEDDMTLLNVYDLSKTLKEELLKETKDAQKVCIQTREEDCKKEILRFKGDPLFDVMPEDNIDHMETDNAQSEGRTREMVDEDKEIDEVRLSTEDAVSTDKEGVSTDFEKVSTDKPKVSTDGSKVSTDEQVEGTEEHNEGSEEIFESTEEQREGTEEKVESTAGQIEGTEDQSKEEIATPASQTSTQTPTSIIFGDDETIATLLINMSQAKAASKEKEKGPLPKIDPKDKGKKKIEEDDESESEDDDIPQAVKKFKQLESDEELARKVQEEWEAEEERNRLAEEEATNEVHKHL
ncbi:hypothetical protein Tco_0084040 [Tanacetum coccineum]